MPRRSAFTLVELLMVIAIISILAGLLLPALETAVGQARQIACINNERQIGSAIQYYADDYEACLPPSWRGVTPVYPAWYVLAGEYLEGTSIFYGCPEDNICKDVEYGYNYRYLGMVTYGVASIVKRGQVAKPSETLVTADSHGNADGWSSQWIENQYPGTSFEIMRMNHGACSIADRRHGGGASVLFLDGHVVSTRWDDLYATRDLWDRE